MHEALDALALAGIEAITLKGPALAEALWPDPGARPFTDLDLLVHERDRIPAVGALTAIGYRHLSLDRTLQWELAHGTTVTLVPEGGDGPPIDLHWRLIEWPRAQRIDRMAPAEVWQRAILVEVGARPALMPAWEDLLIYLAVHFAVHHVLAGEHWWDDLGLLLERRHDTLDWAAVVERARRWRVRTALWLALDAIARASDGRVPDAALARLRPRPARRAVLRRLVSLAEAKRRRLEHFFALLLVDRGRDRARAALASVVPTPAWVRLRYGTVSTVAAYRAHAARLFGLAVRPLGHK